MGIINQIGKLGLNLYLFYFVIYTLMTMKKSIRSKQVIKMKVLHSSVFVICIGWVFFVFFDDRLGIDQFGFCGETYYRINIMTWYYPVIKIILNTSFLALSFYTYYYFKKHKPVADGLLKRIYHQNQKISFFVIVQSILICIYDASISIVYFNCFRQNPIPQLLIFSTLMNIARLCQIVFMLYFIQSDTSIKKKVKKYLRSFFKKSIEDKKQSFHSNNSHQINMNNFNDQQGNSIELTLKQRILQIKEEQHQIDLYQVTQIMTIIAGVLIAHKEYFNHDNENINSLNNVKNNTPSSNRIYSHTELNKQSHQQQQYSIKKLHFQQRITFHIQNSTLHDYNINLSNIPKAGILKSSITMIAPRIFNKLLKSDNLHFVQKSFNLQQNYSKMYHIAQGNGGKSGQFFFFSHDYKYVLKTINKLEYNFIVENLQQFYQYYENNPNSLLAKIYGLYTIKGQEIDVSYDMILMKNIFGCEKKQIIRTYDLKGSKYHREVIQQEKGMCNQLESITLKDTNFINLQGKIHIQNKYINQLRDMIKKDTLFLKNFNLIDYSLLLVRVKWDKQPENKRFWNKLQRIQSVKQKGEYYHIGIIDYMQAWNMSKKSQNWFKRLIGKKQISAQQPNFYQKRFIQFFDTITHTQQYQKYAFLKQSSKKEQQQHKSQQLSSSRTKFINIQQQLYKINKKYSQSIISIDNNSNLQLNTSNNLSQFNVSSPDHMLMRSIYQHNNNNSKDSDLNQTILKDEERKYSQGVNGFNKKNNDQMKQNQSDYHEYIDENNKSQKI